MPKRTYSGATTEDIGGGLEGLPSTLILDIEGAGTPVIVKARRPGTTTWKNLAGIDLGTNAAVTGGTALGQGLYSFDTRGLEAQLVISAAVVVSWEHET